MIPLKLQGPRLLNNRAKLQLHQNKSSNVETTDLARPAISNHSAALHFRVSSTLGDVCSDRQPDVKKHYDKNK